MTFLQPISRLTHARNTLIFECSFLTRDVSPVNRKSPSLARTVPVSCAHSRFTCPTWAGTTLRAASTASSSTLPGETSAPPLIHALFTVSLSFNLSLTLPVLSLLLCSIDCLSPTHFLRLTHLSLSHSLTHSFTLSHTHKQIHFNAMIYACSRPESETLQQVISVSLFKDHGRVGLCMSLQC